MQKIRWLLAVSLAMAASLLPAAARASTVHDQAGLFKAPTVSQAQAELDRIERETRIPTTIETVPSLDGENIRDVLNRHAREAKASGLYVLIAKKEAKIAVEPSNRFRSLLPSGRTDAISSAFLGGFKKHDFDTGLLEGVRAIGREASLARADAPPVARPRAAPAQRPFGAPDRVPARGGGGGGFGFGALLVIGLLVVGVLVVFRLLGSALGGGMGRGSGGPGGPGGPMGRPGYGFGGGGGGFMSSLFGGIGGALAGNWIYDQFSGRRGGGGYADNTSSDPGAAADTGPDDWGGSGGSVGDWGGGDAGGGGDWGGGGDGGGGGSSGGEW
jgi:uncharacterized protein